MTGPHNLPPPHSADWRLFIARQMIREGWRKAVTYLEQAGDPRPAHTAAQAVWREAIERTAAAVPANDRQPFPLTGDGEE